MGDNTQKAIAILIKANIEAAKLMRMQRVKFDYSLNGVWQLDVSIAPKKPRNPAPIGKPPILKKRTKKGASRG